MGAWGAAGARFASFDGRRLGGGLAISLPPTGSGEQTLSLFKGLRGCRICACSSLLCPARPRLRRPRRSSRSVAPQAPKFAMVHSGPFSVIANSRDLSYSEVACVTILTWDFLIMFSEEVRASIPIAVRR